MPPPTGLAIRLASSDDADAVLELAKKFATSFAVAEQSFRSSFADLLRDPSAIVVVAELDGVIVGYLLGFAHLTFFANGRVAWVEELMVDEHQRRKGIGEALMNAMSEWSVGQGCRMIALATRRAADFYQALGFEASASYFRKLLVERPDV